MTRPPVTDVDLSLCEREPIHLLGAIQPHGVLLAFSALDLTLQVVSSNCRSLLGRSPEQVLGRRLPEVLPQQPLSGLMRAMENPGSWPLRIDLAGRHLTGLLHTTDGLTVLELEPASAEESIEGSLAAVDHLFSPLSRVHGPRSLLQAAADVVRRLTGFERVMVYRFDADWHGEVLAESREPHVGSFLGMHFPASDIPSQARALYTRNTLRLIADVEGVPVPLVPERLPELGRPLDLSGAALRSVSPVHLEYLSNMGVCASFSLSLVREGQLWGLIACHNTTPRLVPAVMRRACDALARLLSLQLFAEERAAESGELARRAALRNQLVQRLSASPYVLSVALAHESELLLRLTHAQGAALLLGGPPLLVGQTPPLPFIRELSAWLAQQPANPVFHTDRLGQIYPPAQRYAELASGLLMVRLDPTEPRFILWFRPEQTRTVTWAGNPEKPVQPRSPGAARLQPRASFEDWQETVRGQSQSWSWVDVDSADELHGSLVGVLLRHAAALARSNVELDAFSGTVAHDLKEPLRGIQYYTELLREDCGERLGQQGQSHLEQVEWLVGRTRELMEALFEYSRWGHVEQAWGSVDLQQVVDDVLRTLAALYQKRQVQVRLPRRLPAVECDPVRVREVWANLLSNAARYHQEGAERWVEVGYYGPEEPLPSSPPRHKGEHVFYVRDNGIGIDEQFHESIFAMFRRLHPADEHGGNGAGLAIARRLVRLYGGELWLESTPGRGSTFFFTLGRALQRHEETSASAAGGGLESGPGHVSPSAGA